MEFKKFIYPILIIFFTVSLYFICSLIFNHPIKNVKTDILVNVKSYNDLNFEKPVSIKIVYSKRKYCYFKNITSTLLQDTGINKFLQENKTIKQIN